MQTSGTETLLQPIRKKVGAAIGRFDLIEQGDVIAIGLSGGKDSTTMLRILSKLQKHAPVSFTLKAVTIDLGWGIDVPYLERLCKEHNVYFHFEKTQIGKIVFEHRQEKSPCSLCANLRRGAVNNAAKDLGCNKVALGHHLDDMIETFLLGLFYEGRIHTFSPKVYLSRKNLTVIRPMVFVEEAEIIRCAQAFDHAALESRCPIDGHTKRKRMKDLIEQLSSEIPDIRSKMLSSVQNMDIDPLWFRD